MSLYSSIEYFSETWAYLVYNPVVCTQHMLMVFKHLLVYKYCSIGDMFESRIMIHNVVHSTQYY